MALRRSEARRRGFEAAARRAAALGRLLIVVGDPDTGEHYKDHHIKRWMEQLVERGKLTVHGTHVLRKTCGTRIADGGGGVSAVASHLRHKSLQTASRYIDRRGAGSRAPKALES